MIVILIAFYLLVLLIELPGLISKKLYKELIVFMVFFAISLYMGLAFFYQWPLAGPFEALATYMGR